MAILILCASDFLMPLLITILFSYVKSPHMHALHECFNSFFNLLRCAFGLCPITTQARRIVTVLRTCDCFHSFSDPLSCRPLFHCSNRAACCTFVSRKIDSNSLLSLVWFKHFFWPGTKTS